MANPAKVNCEVLELWSQILLRIPNSRLLLCYCGWPDPSNRQRVRDVLGKYGLEDRVHFDYQAGHGQLLKRYGDVDLALDTFPYSGGLTTCEAMWMGVPTISLIGNRFAGRHSFSHLSNAGLGQFAAENSARYLEIAMHWAADRDGLAEIRSTMRSRVECSHLCNASEFTFAFEQLLENLFARRFAH